VNGGSEYAGPRTGDTVAGFLAALAIFGALLSLIWYPGRVGTAAIFLALVAVALADEHRRLAAGALIFAGVAWLVGMVLAILVGRPIF
jgi:hypothetical protein